MGVGCLSWEEPESDQAKRWELSQSESRCLDTDPNATPASSATLFFLPSLKETRSIFSFVNYLVKKSSNTRVD